MRGTASRGTPGRSPPSTGNASRRGFPSYSRPSTPCSPKATALSPYHLEARIAAAHSTSPAFDRTDWPRILGLYDHLLRLKDTPAVRLNRIVALRYAAGPQTALEALEALPAQAPLPAATAYLRHAVRADLLEALGRVDQAQQAWNAALAGAPTDADRRFVTRRARSVRGDVPAGAPRASS